MPFSFHEGLPDGLKFNFDLGIFHDPKHLNLQSPSGWNSFYIRNENQVEGIVHIHIDQGKAVSPFKSPFGSFIFSDSVDEATLIEFIWFVEKALVSKGVKSLRLKNQPALYASNENQLLAQVLLKAGYAIEHEETSAVIPITETSFEAGLHKSEKKRLRKCRDSKLVFERVQSDQLQKIYSFLDACRKEKGYSLSMAYEEVQKLSQVFPERIILTAVTDQHTLAAANISIRVYDYVLYNFYHDHASDYDQFSPVVLLNEGLYNFAQQNEMSCLDLGTSNIAGKVNESLLGFKLNLGAKRSPKLMFTKTLT